MIHTWNGIYSGFKNRSIHMELILLPKIKIKVLRPGKSLNATEGDGFIFLAICDINSMSRSDALAKHSSKALQCIVEHTDKGSTINRLVDWKSWVVSAFGPTKRSGLTHCYHLSPEVLIVKQTYIHFVQFNLDEGFFSVRRNIS